LDSGFVVSGTWTPVPIVRGIPDSLSCIPDFKAQDFRFRNPWGDSFSIFPKPKNNRSVKKITDKEVNNCRILNWYRINLHLFNSFEKTGNVLEMEDVRLKGHKTAVSPLDHGLETLFCYPERLDL